MAIYAKYRRVFEIECNESVDRTLDYYWTIHFRIASYQMKNGRPQIYRMHVHCARICRRNKTKRVINDIFYMHLCFSSSKIRNAYGKIQLKFRLFRIYIRNVNCKPSILICIVFVVILPLSIWCNCIGCCSVGYLLVVFASVSARFNDYVSVSIGCSEKQMVNFECRFSPTLPSEWCWFTATTHDLSKNGFQSRQAQKWTNSGQTIKHKFQSNHLQENLVISVSIVN